MHAPLHTPLPPHQLTCTPSPAHSTLTPTVPPVSPTCHPHVTCVTCMPQCHPCHRVTHATPVSPVCYRATPVPPVCYHVTRVSRCHSHVTPVSLTLPVSPACLGVPPHVPSVPKLSHSGPVPRVLYLQGLYTAVQPLPRPGRGHGCPQVPHGCPQVPPSPGGVGGTWVLLPRRSWGSPASPRVSPDRGWVALGDRSLSWSSSPTCGGREVALGDQSPSLTPRQQGGDTWGLEHVLGSLVVSPSQ